MNALSVLGRAARAPARGLSWRASASTLEEISFLPILNIMKGLPVVQEIAPTASSFRAVVDMVKYRTGSLIVMDGSSIAGIVTERDVLDKLPLAVGDSRATPVSTIMTPSASLVTAPPSFTLDKCVQQMKSGVFRHLPIVSKGQTEAVVSMRDIAQQISSALAKKPLASPPLVSELMDAKGTRGCSDMPTSGTVADAVEILRQTKAGSVLVTDGPGFSLFTERDYLTKVAVYDERAPAEIGILEVRRPPRLEPATCVGAPPRPRPQLRRRARRPPPPFRRWRRRAPSSRRWRPTRA